MDSNAPEIEKSIGRTTGTDEAPAADRPTCSTSWCDAPVSRRIVEEDGRSVEYERCAKGHYGYRRTLDVDGSTYRAFKAFSIAGP